MNRPDRVRAWRRCLAGAVLIPAAYAAAATDPALTLVERDGAAWVILDGRLATAAGGDLAVEWKAPWLTLRAGGRTLRTAAGWRAAITTGGVPVLCWLPDPPRAEQGRPALTPPAVAAALTALGRPRRWDRENRRLVAFEPVASPAAGPAAAAAAAPVPAAPEAPVELPPSAAEEAPVPAPRAAGRPAPRAGPLVIVVDAGHGGQDCGAQGKSGLCEKTVTLDIARRLGALLRERGAKVVMTRETDTFIPLPERVAITRRANADLFVSVHVNASPNRGARGVETYVYGARAMGRSAEEAVRRENADANYMEIALGDLEQQAHHESSIRVAGSIENSIVAKLRAVGRAKNRVFAAPFYVLARAGRPAVLVEVGFISHREEERKLRDPAYRRKLAESISAGVDLSGGAAAAIAAPRTGG